MRLWLASLLALTATTLAGFSWMVILFYGLFTAASIAFARLFLANKCELDFDCVFKVFEWVGYGAPRFLEPSRLSTSATLYNSTDGQNTNSLNEIPRPIARNLNKLIGNFIRDFIISWYKDVGEGESFVSEAQTALEMLSLEGYKRTAQVDAHYQIEKVILLFHSHLERFNNSVSVLRARDPNLKLSISTSQLLHQTYESQIQSKHIALSNTSLELSYLRNVVDSLLAVLLPKQTFSCDMGRFILREILAVQAVELVDLVSDSDWVNEAIIDLLTPPPNTETLPADRITSDGEIEWERNIDGIPSQEHNKITTSDENINILINNGNGTFDREQVHGKIDSKSTSVGEFKERASSPEFSEQVFTLGTPSTPQKGYSESFVVISTATETKGNIVDNINHDSNCPGANQDLSSSWGICPPSRDASFLMESFEAMKNQETPQRKHGIVGPRLVGLGSEVKKISSCCTALEVSDEIDAAAPPELTASVDFLHSRRSRSASHPENLCDIGSNTKDHHVYTNHEVKLLRSVSVPCLMSSISENPQSEDLSVTPPSTELPVEFYGSPYYNISFCSSEGSFKSFTSNDGFEVEEAEEMDEILSGNTDSDSSDDIVPLMIRRTPRKSITKQSFVDIDTSSEQTITTDKSDFPGSNRPWVEPGSSCPDKAASTATRDSLDDVFQSPSAVRSNNRSDGSKDSVDSNAKSPTKRTSPNTTMLSQKSESESFSDSVLMAGRKFISSIKSPGKTFGFSSTRSSTTSTSTSSGFDSMEVNVPSSIERDPSLDMDNLSNHELSQRVLPGSGRKLSRSNAIIELSSESDTETWCGMPTEHAPIKEEIVYGTQSNAPGASASSSAKGVVKIHPSQLITIPETEVALESALEPGRNKFTLYKIEFDIRIWPNVYKALLDAIGGTKREMTLTALKNSSEHPDNSNNRATNQRAACFEGRGVPLKRVIKRRYREFMELHNRLCSGPLAVQMKDVLKPNRKYNLPFGRLDREVVEGRQKILQYYLVSLVSKPDLRNSMDLQQFLGVISSDVSSFIKPSVAQMINQSVHVPRVDKMLGRQMTKVFDTIKTAFDSDGPDSSENVMSPPPDDTGSPWRIVCHDQAMTSADMDEEDTRFSPEECFDTFLDKLEDGDPLSPLLQQHSDDITVNEEEHFSGLLSSSPWRYSALHDDCSSDDEVMWPHLGPRTAGDGSDSPDEVSTVSHASADDLIFGALGNKPPGDPPSISLSASTGCLKDHDTTDNRDSPYWSSPRKSLGPSLSMPSCTTDSFDSEDAKRFSHHMPFSKKSFEKLKHAADHVKHKKIESVENIQAAREKVKALKDDKLSVEKLRQAAQQVKQKKHDSVESIHAAKEKMMALKDEQLKHAAEELKQKKQDSLGNIQATKEKMKALKVEKFKQAAEQVKQKHHESVESIQAAKEKVKSLNVEKMKQAAEQVKQKKDESLENVQAATGRLKAGNVERFKQAAEQVKQKKDESLENVQVATGRLKAANIERFKQAAEQVKQKKDESLENVQAATGRLKAANVERFKQVAEQVKERKHESDDKMHAAREKVKAMKDEKFKEVAERVKHTKHESMENIQAAKEKAKALKKTPPNPKIIIKEHDPGQDSHDPSEKLMRMPDGAELRYRRPPGVADEPLAMSVSDRPSEKVSGGVTEVRPGDPQCPLSDAILNLTCEILKDHDSWSSLERVQQAFMGVFGSLFEWFLQREIDDLFTEDNWGIYLGNLNDVIWPNGQLRQPPDELKSEEEKLKTKKLAVETLMEFFPDLFSFLVGSKLYNECAENAVESLQNPDINRILVYMLMETFLAEFIPELQTKLYTD